ncbi:MAG TPA: SRPBCC family protein [Solirubrobacteraceae bacterium]
MIEGEKSETITAPAERIWAIISNVEAYPQWHPFFASVDVTGRDGDGRATRARCMHKTPAGDLHTEIAFTYDPQSEVEAARAGGDLKDMQGIFRLTSDGGATVVTHRLVVDPGFKLGLLLRGPVADRVRESVLNGALRGIAAQAAGD